MCPVVSVYGPGHMFNYCMSEAEESRGEGEDLVLLESSGGLHETGGTWLALGE